MIIVGGCVLYSKLGYPTFWRVTKIEGRTVEAERWSDPGEKGIFDIDEVQEEVEETEE